MSDHDSHVTGSHERTARAGGTRVGDSGSPVGSPLTIVLALIAVTVGFLIFRSIGDNDNAGGGLPDGATTTPTTIAGQTTIVGGTPAPAGATTPTTPAPTRSGATVVVINAGEVPQSAAGMTEELAGLGYTMADGISDNDQDEAAETVVYFAGPGGPEAVARSVANDLGGVTVEAAPSDMTTLINPDDTPGAATVFVMLGQDLSGDSLPLPQPTSTTTG